jgi:inositol phosphorylceramide synthase catalytic subunit
MNDLWDKEAWLRWWSGLGPRQKAWPGAAAVLYWLALGLAGGLRPDLVFVSLVPVALYYLGPRFHPLAQFALPICLVSVIYDSQRYYAHFLRGTVHVAEPFAFDKRFFGIATAKGVLIPAQWWQLNTHWALDLVTGLAYILFIPVFAACALYMRFWLSRTGTGIAHPRSIAYRSPQIAWAFLWVNVAGYLTYLIYPAAPPWYVELYGLGPARLDIPASAAGCARFDALVGLPIFREWYGKIAVIHGAIPSLHVAYPLIIAYYAFRFGALRLFSSLFFLLMCFSAVYLNHHYVLDVLWGAAYGAAVAFGLDMYWNWDFKRKGIIVPGPDPEIDGAAMAPA